MMNFLKKPSLIAALGIVSSSVAFATPESCESNPEEFPICPTPLVAFKFKELRCPDGTANSICDHVYLPPPATLECGAMDQGGLECVAGPINPSLSYVWQSSNPGVIAHNVGGYFEVFTCERFRTTTITVTVSNLFGYSQSVSVQTACLRTATGGSGSQQPR